MSHLGHPGTVKTRPILHKSWHEDDDSVDDETQQHVYLNRLEMIVHRRGLKRMKPPKKEEKIPKEKEEEEKEKEKKKEKKETTTTTTTTTKSSSKFVFGYEEDDDLSLLGEKAPLDPYSGPDDPLTFCVKRNVFKMDGGLKGEEACDWSQRFDSLVDEIKEFNSGTPLNNKIETNEELMRLASDFLLSAELYGRTIISEVFLPEAQRSIPAVNKGGIAGGQKYITHNILFKFALLDNDVIKKMYHGEENAAKAAGHELKGAMSYFKCMIKNLYFPLMAIIDYRGFRLLAMSLLPITNGRGKLVYGSSNGGVLVENSDPIFAEKMKQAADKLNLAEHPVSSRRIKICSAFDVEGICVSETGKYYMLDLARVFPAEPKGPLYWPNHSTSLFRLFRPELVKKSPKALSSDAGKMACVRLFDIHYRQWIRETEELKNDLFQKIIPEFAEKLVQKVKDHITFLEEKGSHGDTPRPMRLRSLSMSLHQSIGLTVSISQESSEDESSLLTLKDGGESYLEVLRQMSVSVFGESFPLKQLMHAEGMNMRHMGHVFRQIRELIPDKEVGKEQALTLVFIEMCSRTIRQNIRRRFRSMMREKKIPLEEPYRLLLVDCLNYVFGISEPDPSTMCSSRDFWVTLKEEIIEKFEAGSFTERQLQPSFDFRELMVHQIPGGGTSNGKCLLFLRLKKLMGFAFDEITEMAATSREMYFENARPFDVIDLRAMGARVKHMGVVNHARGYIYKIRAAEIRKTNPNKATILLQKARENFEEVLESDPTNAVTLRNCGQVNQQLETLNVLIEDATPEKLNPKAEGVIAAKDYYTRAVEAKQGDTHSLYQLAQFYAECGEFDEAEKYFLESLEADPWHIAALFDYGQLLRHKKLKKLANKLAGDLTVSQVESVYPIVEPSLFHQFSADQLHYSVHLG